MWVARLGLQTEGVTGKGQIRDYEVKLEQVTKSLGYLSAKELWFYFFRDDINKQETFTHIIKRLIQKSCGSVLGGDKTGCKVGRELKLEH